MFIPKKTKYKKLHKGRINCSSGVRRTEMKKGKIGIIASQEGILYPYQLTALKNALKRKMKKTGRIWFHSFAHFQKTKKSLGVRMGKGKGPVSTYFCRIRPYQLIAEFKLWKRYSKNRMSYLGYICKSKISLPTMILSKRTAKWRYHGTKVYRSLQNRTRIRLYKKTRVKFHREVYFSHYHKKATFSHKRINKKK